MAEAIRTSIDLDDSGFQAAAKRVVDAANKIIDTERQIVPATTGAASAFERLKRSLDPTYDAQKKLVNLPRIDGHLCYAPGRGRKVF
jgi:hypothetical protein